VTTAKSALVIVDVQVDFCPGGALAVPEGDKVVPVFNGYITRFIRAGLPIFATGEWHPPVTRHFQECGGPMPRHAVVGTKGTEFHPGLELPEHTIVISKGTDPEAETSYSSFEGYESDGTDFGTSLRKRGIGHLYIGGLATDFCVRATALEALRNGYEVTLLKDAIRGLNPGDSERAIDEMISAGAKTATLETLS
jgi:nicotinamidase/pyrazinamidase